MCLPTASCAEKRLVGRTSRHANAPDRLERERGGLRRDVPAGRRPGAGARVRLHATLRDVAPRPPVRADRPGRRAVAPGTCRRIRSPPSDTARLRLRRADAPVHLLGLRGPVYRHAHRAFRGGHRASLLRFQLLSGRVLRRLQAGYQPLRSAVSDRPVDGRLPPLSSEAAEVQALTLRRRDRARHPAVPGPHRVSARSAASISHARRSRADPLGRVSTFAGPERGRSVDSGRRARGHVVVAHAGQYGAAGVHPRLEAGAHRHWPDERLPARY